MEVLPMLNGINHLFCEHSKMLYFYFFFIYIYFFVNLYLNVPEKIKVG